MRRVVCWWISGAQVIPGHPSSPPEIPWRSRLRQPTLHHVRIKIRVSGSTPTAQVSCCDYNQRCLKQTLTTAMISCGALTNNLTSLIRPAIRLQQWSTRSFIPSLDQTGPKWMSSTVIGESGREYVMKDVLRKWPKDPEFNIYRVECVERLLPFPRCPFRPET